MRLIMLSSLVTLLSVMIFVFEDSTLDRHKRQWDEAARKGARIKEPFDNGIRTTYDSNGKISGRTEDRKGYRYYYNKAGKSIGVRKLKVGESRNTRDKTYEQKKKDEKELRDRIRIQRQREKLTPLEWIQGKGK